MLKQSKTAEQKPNSTKYSQLNEVKGVKALESEKSGSSFQMSCCVHLSTHPSSSWIHKGFGVAYKGARKNPDIK